MFPVIRRHHGSEVVKVAFLNQRLKKMGCFLTVTKDGVLQFWSETFSMMESFRVSGTLMGLVECLCCGTLSGLVLGTQTLSEQPDSEVTGLRSRLWLNHRGPYTFHMLSRCQPGCPLGTPKTVHSRSVSLGSHIHEHYPPASVPGPSLLLLPCHTHTVPKSCWLKPLSGPGRKSWYLGSGVQLPGLESQLRHPPAVGCWLRCLSFLICPESWSSSPSWGSGDT